EQPDARRPRGEEGQQRERLQKAPLIRVVLDADEVQAGAVGALDLVDDRLAPGRVGDHEHAELDAGHRARIYPVCPREPTGRRTTMPNLTTPFRGLARQRASL